MDLLLPAANCRQAPAIWHEPWHGSHQQAGALCNSTPGSGCSRWRQSCVLTDVCIHVTPLRCPLDASNPWPDLQIPILGLTCTEPLSSDLSGRTGLRTDPVTYPARHIPARSFGLVYSSRDFRHPKERCGLGGLTVAGIRWTTRRRCESESTSCFSSSPACALSPSRHGHRSLQRLSLPVIIAPVAVRLSAARGIRRASMSSSPSINERGLRRWLHEFSGKESWLLRWERKVRDT